jgi:hypothetical protein
LVKRQSIAPIEITQEILSVNVGSVDVGNVDERSLVVRETPLERIISNSLIVHYGKVKELVERSFIFD